MRGMIPLTALVGTAEPLNPAQVAFIARPGKSCASCLFRDQRSAVCRAAGEEAARRQIDDCELGVVYVAPAVDERQQTIFEV